MIGFSIGLALLVSLLLLLLGEKRCSQQLIRPEPAPAPLLDARALLRFRVDTMRCTNRKRKKRTREQRREKGKGTKMGVLMFFSSDGLVSTNWTQNAT